MTLFDAETGKTQKMRAGNCSNIAAKGFRLLGQPGEVELVAQRRDEAAENLQNQQSITQAAKGHRNTELDGKDAIVTTKAQRKYNLRPRNALGVVVGRPLSKAQHNVDKSEPENSVPISPNRTPKRASAKKGKSKSRPSLVGPGGVGAWLDLENRLRRAQGKNPLSIRRAPPGTLDQVGCPMYVSSPLQPECSTDQTLQTLVSRRCGDWCISGS